MTHIHLDLGAIRVLNRRVIALDPFIMYKLGCVLAHQRLGSKDKAIRRGGRRGQPGMGPLGRHRHGTCQTALANSTCEKGIHQMTVVRGHRDVKLERGARARQTCTQDDDTQLAAIATSKVNA